MATVIVTSKKDGLVAKVNVDETIRRFETPDSHPRAKIWYPTVADIKKHFPEEVGYQITVR